MSLFRRKDRVLTARQEELASAWAVCLVALQRRLADRLNARTVGFSLRTWWVIFIVFNLLAGAYCFWLVLYPFIH